MRNSMHAIVVAVGLFFTLAFIDASRAEDARKRRPPVER